MKSFLLFDFVPLQKDDFVVAIKVIAKKNISKTQNLLAKEIKILKVGSEYLQLLIRNEFYDPRLTYCIIHRKYCMITTYYSQRREITIVHAVIMCNVHGN